MRQKPSAEAQVVRTHYEPGYRSDWHHHRSAQLMYPSRGVMRLQTRAGEWVIPPLRACWLPAREEHRVESSSSLQMHSVYCQGGLLRRLPQRFGVVGVSALLHEIILVLEQAAYRETVEPAATRIVDVIPDEVRLQAVPPLPAPPPLSRRLAPIQRALAENPADSRTLTAWAEQLDTTTRTLARAFEREARMTFRAYRQQMRLRAAMERLAYGQSATQVAYDVGFSSPSNFIAAFRAAVGITPGAYFRTSREERR
jgi:AraC-like DNA-binding protein